MGTEENAIKKELAIFLDAIGYTWNVNNGRIRRKYKISEEGSADRQGTIRWKGIQTPVQVETKTLVGKLSPTQKYFRNKWILAGGCYIVARNIDDLITGLDEYAESEKKRLTKWLNIMK